MKRITIIFMFLLPALSIWGLEEDDAQAIFKKIETLKNKNEEVLNSYTQNLSGGNAINVDETQRTLNLLFEKIDSIKSYIGEDKSIINTLNQFIQEYSDAIYMNANNQTVYIGTKSFITCAQKYTTIFEKYLRSKQTSSGDNKRNSGDNDQESNSDESYNTDSDESYNTDSDESDKKESLLLPYILIGFVGLLSLVSLILCILLLNKNAKIQNKLKKCEGEIMRLNGSITNVGKKVQHQPQTPSNVSTNQQLPPTPANISNPNSSKQNNNIQPTNTTVRTQSCAQLKPEQPQIKKEPQQIVCLFASAKANSTEREFYKVTENSSSDKVFMLKLQKINDVSANFTLVPSMTQDFIKAVLDNHITYLPEGFCVKENASSSGTLSRIEVKSEGTAEKVDGKWIVRNPMSIRLL